LPFNFETVKDLETMAEGLARPENKRAASAYLSSPLRGFDPAGRIDEAHLARAGFGKAAHEAGDRQSVISDSALGSRTVTNARLQTHEHTTPLFTGEDRAGQPLSGSKPQHGTCYAKLPARMASP
jgi:hypothetical protein